MNFKITSWRNKFKEENKKPCFTASYEDDKGINEEDKQTNKENPTATMKTLSFVLKFQIYLT